MTIPLGEDGGVQLAARTVEETAHSWKFNGTEGAMEKEYF